MIGPRTHAPREVVVSRSKLESLLWDNPDAAVVVTAAAKYLLLDGTAFVLPTVRGVA